MAINILSQPDSDTLVAAYRPIEFWLDCNQLPNNTGPSPIVIGDIYFDGTYYASMSVADYDPLITWLFSFYFYTFDIQDKVQEYLDSKFQRMYENTQGDMEDRINEKFSCSIRIKFRESYIDTNGFTQFYGNAPVQGTKFTAPVSGSGETATSNLFYALNATLTHEDTLDFPTHLDTFKDPFQTTYTLSHRPNFISYINLQIAGGKYFIAKEDHDWIWCFSNASNPPWYVQVIVKYKDGTTFNTFPSTPLYPTTTTTAAQFRVYGFNAGIPNLRTIFGTVNWDNVVEYEIFIWNAFFQAMRQSYIVQRSCEHVRIFFLNNLGTYDGINFECVEEINKSNSGSWQAPGKSFYQSPSKAWHTNNRIQPKQNDFYQAQCKEYGEQDMNWIKELLGSPRAYIQWNGIQSQSDGLLAIKIEDSEIQTLKINGRYEYIINIKYSLSNERINLR